MNPNYALVAERARHRCEYCHAPEAVFNVPFEVEHIVPLAQGGLHKDSNWALACRSCNLNKSDRTSSTDPETQQQVRLFHPRKDNWSHHFAVGDTPPFHVHGLTPIGRATVEQMKMNSSLQLAARAQWMVLRLFP
jgi:hypothetical protein